MKTNGNKNNSYYRINETRHSPGAGYIIFIFTGLLFLTVECTTTRKTDEPAPVYQEIKSNMGETGHELMITFTKGKSHNHPLMALWTEDSAGKYIETLYVAESIGNGVFSHGDKTTGKWLPGEIRRPAALPYWAHKRGEQAEDGLYIPSSKNPMPDAVSGATPPGDFVLKTKTREGYPDKFRVMFEINQTWDWNEYWTNNKYPDNDEYKTSCQPALIYSATVTGGDTLVIVDFTLIGHSHYAGENGNLYTDLSTITTAKDITKSIQVKLRK